ncbi:hypothetical protein HOP52_06700 [Halomonas campisalis]|uniref:Secreted protein n=1 Tax=Billgrantia campisalis TaxID=74661 RepID=A0ABS9P6P9_9GAMM|nr:hypothetical protein [Halomonas campisalis]MCG6657453.1 hypothetical protein [Halomonas campisalis]MDR5863201.1 hypothetical protein [Halomonas campisalis]
MRRAVLQWVSLCLILALSAGTLTLAGLDAAGGTAHGVHTSLEVETDEAACEHTTHTAPDECWTPCLGASHCLAGAANVDGALPTTAVDRPPLAWPGFIPPTPYDLHERPPRAA